MSQRLLRFAGLAIVSLSCVALAFSSGIVGSTFALFNGETQNAGSSFAGGWIGAATGLTTTASGYDVGLAWTPGTHGPVTGQQLYGVDNNTNSNCTGAAYVLLNTLATASTATFTDSSRGSASNNGHWFCYQLVSTSASSWTAQTPQVLQLGLVTSAITITNVGTNNSMNANDTIQLTFNQRTNKATSGTLKVCAINNGSSDSVIIGDTTGGTGCAAADGFNVGVITGVTIGTTRAYANSTFTTTTTSPFTMTITLVSSGTSTYSGTTATFTPSSSILSNATTHQATMCTTAAAICQPTTATHF